MLFRGRNNGNESEIGRRVHFRCKVLSEIRSALSSVELIQHGLLQNLKAVLMEKRSVPSAPTPATSTSYSVDGATDGTSNGRD